MEKPGALFLKKNLVETNALAAKLQKARSRGDLGLANKADFLQPYRESCFIGRIRDVLVGIVDSSHTRSEVAEQLGSSPFSIHPRGSTRTKPPPASATRITDA